MGVGINVQPHAVRELHDLGLAEALQSIGLQTEEVAYFSAQGGRIWSEPRGRFAGYNWPQYSIHRGELQMLLRDTLIARAGADALTVGSAVTGWAGAGDGIEITLTDRARGWETGKAMGAVLIAADGINSAARARLYPNEGVAHWAGVMMWRGITEGPQFLTGRTMAMAGKQGAEIRLLPDPRSGERALSDQLDRRSGVPARLRLVPPGLEPAGQQGRSSAEIFGLAV